MKKVISLLLATACLLTLSACSANPTESLKEMFEDFTEDTVDKLTLVALDESSGLRVSASQEGLSFENIGNADYWKATVTDDEIRSSQGNTYLQNIGHATWNGTELVKPADETAVDLETGAYDGAMTTAMPGTDYQQYVLYFRSEHPNAKVMLSMTEGFRTASDNDSLLPAISMLVNGTVYTNDSLPNDAVIAVCTERVGDYYVGDAVFSLYIDGEKTDASSPYRSQAYYTMTLNESEE